MDPVLTLNDFRSLLGKTNDGNVVLTVDEKGVEKVNHGNALTQKVWRYRTVANDPEMNQRVRNLFMQAVQNSQEGKSLTKRQLEVFRGKLGVGLDPVVTSRNEFSRTELKLALESLDSMLVTGKEPEPGGIVVQGDPDPALGGLSMMVKRQHELMLQKGLNTDTYRKIMAQAEHAVKHVPCLSSVTAMAEMMPKQLHGHARGKLKKFVENNFHLIQSQVYDRLVWVQGESLKHQLNLPPEQQSDRLRLDARGVLIDTISDMMQTYGARKEPTPRIERLLAHVPAEPLPEDAQTRTALEAFHAKTSALMGAMFKVDEDASLFEHLQLSFFRKRMQVALDQTFIREFGKTAGSAEEKDRAAEAKASEFASDFFGSNADELDRLMSNPAARKMFGAELSAQLERKGVVDGAGAIPDDQLRSAFRGAFAVLSRAADLLPVVEAYVKEANIGEDRRKDAVAQLKKAIQTVPDLDLHQLFADMRLGLLKAKVLGEVNDDNLSAKATQLKNESPAFRAFAERVLADFADPAEIQKRRSALLAEFPALNPAWASDPNRTFGDSLVNGVQISLAALRESPEITQLPEPERQQRLAEYEKLLMSKEFIGCLVLSGELDGLDYDRHWREYEGLGKTKAEIDTNIKWFKDRADAISLPELQFDFQYVKLGMGYADAMARSQANVMTNPFRALLRDGTIDFASLDKSARRYLTEQIQVLLKAHADEDDNLMRAMDMGSVLSAEARSAFDAAITQAAQELGMQNSREKVKAVIAYNHSFGTADPARILRVLAFAGLTITDLNTVEGMVKIHRLCMLINAHGMRGEGVVEWAERVTGKAFDAITFADCYRLVVKRMRNEAIPDPLDKLSGSQLAVAKFLGGSVSTADAGLEPAEMKNLLQTMRTFKPGVAQQAEVVLFGQTVTLMQRASGTLMARLASGARLSLSVSRTAEGLVRQALDHMVDNVEDYGAEFVLANLPPVPKANEVVARARELYSKTLACVLGLPSVNFAHLRTVELERTVRQALTNPQGVRNRFLDPPTTYSSAETVELQEKLLRADRLDLARIVMPPAAATRTVEEREAHPPSQAVVHNLVADLLMNRDTWAFDVGRANPGQRLQTLLAGYGPELRYLCGNNGAALLSSLPAVVRAPMLGIFQQLSAINLNAPDAREKLAAVETQLDALVDTTMATMQTKATQLFAAQPGEQNDLWKQSLSGMVGSSGLDVSTPAGKFTKAVLDCYFRDSDGTEKRAMLASMIRGSNAVSGDGRLVAEMLKGAGPLLQKTLQGLPIETFGPETQVALKDMKSKLLPIPDNVIKAQLLEMVRSSNGEILSIEVKRSLGQATVGQALLCHMRTKTHPVAGEDVVVKLLRPNVQTAIQREYRLFMRVARNLDLQAGQNVRAQQLTFQGQYASILKEFDFTIEADNIDRCLGIYDKPMATFDDNVTNLYDKIRSMDRVVSVPAMTGMLVLEKVEGSSADRLLERTLERLKAVAAKVDPHMERNTALPPSNQVVTTWETDSMVKLLKTKAEFQLLRKKLALQQQRVCQLLDIWLERALFGDGTFHNDLHAGNIMVDDENITVIDFGNVMRLDNTQQNQLVLMLAACIRSKPEVFLKALGKLLPDEMQDTFNAAREQLEDDLDEVFAKGTANDMLPRLMAALAVIQRAGVPVPDTVQNFVQSMSRIQSVVGAFEMSIREVEEASRRVMFTRQFTENLTRQTQDATKELPSIRAALEALNRQIFAHGDVDGMADPYDFMRLGGVIKSEFSKVELVWGWGSGQPVLDPLDHVDPKQRPMLYAICQEFEPWLSRQKDGGVAFLRDMIKRYAFLSGLGLRVSPNGAIAFMVWTGAFKNLTREIDRFEYLRNRKNVTDARIKEGRRDLLRAFCHDMEEMARRIGSGLDDVIISEALELPEFVDSVGESLLNRAIKLAYVFGDDLGISREKFDSVMEAARRGANEATIILKVGLDIFNFRTLQRIAEDIENLRKQAVAHKEKVEEARTKAGNDNAVFPVNERVSFERRRQLDALAHDFLMPKGWKPSFEDGEDEEVEIGDEDGDLGGKQLFREVLEANLAMVRKSLNVQALTPAEIKYFAVVLAAETEKTGLLQFIHDAPEITQFLAKEQQQVENRVPGADADLVALVKALRELESGE